MKVTFLGTGTSTGTPVIGCKCKVCASTDPHDTRLRCSALLETETTRLLIDCGPDFRQQVLPLPFKKIDAILLTHSHYDHVGGIDDVRPFCRFGDVDIYANQRTADYLHHSIPYCFAEIKYPGVPEIRLHTILPNKPLRIGDIDLLPIEVMHGKLPILGYRFGRFAYITDMKTITPQEAEKLKGVEILVVNALRYKREHHSHQLVDEAIAFTMKINPIKTYFIHSCHEIGLHSEVNKKLPPGIELAYDGQQIYV